MLINQERSEFDITLVHRSTFKMDPSQVPNLYKQQRGPPKVNFINYFGYSRINFDCLNFLYRSKTKILHRFKLQLNKFFVKLRRGKNLQRKHLVKRFLT